MEDSPSGKAFTQKLSAVLVPFGRRAFDALVGMLSSPKVDRPGLPASSGTPIAHRSSLIRDRAAHALGHATRDERPAKKFVAAAEKSQQVHV
jgi:hypothetical protein